jgi:hypothetical protein
VTDRELRTALEDLRRGGGELTQRLLGAQPAPPGRWEVSRPDGLADFPSDDDAPDD